MNYTNKPLVKAHAGDKNRSQLVSCSIERYNNELQFSVGSSMCVTLDLSAASSHMQVATLVVKHH